MADKPKVANSIHVKNQRELGERGEIKFIAEEQQEMRIIFEDELLQEIVQTTVRFGTLDAQVSDHLAVLARVEW